MKKMLIYVWVVLIRFFRVSFPEWFAKNCPVKIKRKFPKPPTELCECGKPYTKIVAYFDGGWILWWACEDDCGSPKDLSWWPFWFGVHANDEDFRKLGIEVV